MLHSVSKADSGAAEIVSSSEIYRGLSALSLLRKVLDGAPLAFVDLMTWWVRSSPIRKGTGTLADKIISPILRKRGRAGLIRTLDGIDLYVNPSRADLIQLYLYMFRVWEPVITAWFRATLRSGDVVVDVGANIGYYTTLAARLVGPSGRVIAIEPFPETFQALKENVERNGLTNVYLVNAAVGDGTSLSLYQDPEGALGTISMLQQPGWKHVADVRTVSITEVIPADIRERLRLVKIDAEGAEEVALQSLGSLLSENKGELDLLVECGPSQRNPGIAAQLKERGFSLSGIRNYYGVDDYVREPKLSLDPLPEVIASQIDVIASKSGEI